MNRVHDFLCAVARLGEFVRSYAPDACNILASGGIREGTLPGKLVTLLPMLTPPLPVSLAGNHRGTSAVAPDVTGGECNINYRQAILHAFRLVLQSPSMHHDGPL